MRRLRNNRSTRLSALALVACTALVMAGVAGAGGAVETRITIKSSNGDFHGKIFSSRRRCLGGRNVTVYKLKGNGYDPANDRKVGSDTSERHRDHGVWSAGNTGFKHGWFYALAARSSGCKEAVSKPIQLPSG
jgi:hypothetical protein